MLNFERSSGLKYHTSALPAESTSSWMLPKSVEQPSQLAGVWTTLVKVFAPAYTVIGRPLCATNWPDSVQPPISVSVDPVDVPAEAPPLPERQFVHRLGLEARACDRNPTRA